MTAYQTGKTFEHRVRANLERDGYACLRAAGSKGVADLIGLKPGQVLLVQVKLTNPQLPPTERASLLELARLCGAVPLVAYRTKPRGPVGYRELTGVGPKEWRAWVADEVTAA